MDRPHAAFLAGLLIAVVATAAVFAGGGLKAQSVPDMDRVLRSGGDGQSPTPPPGQLAQKDKGGQAAPQSNVLPEPFPGPAAPLDLEATGDPKHRVTMKIGPAGGVISAKGADGASYQLTVPAKALDDDVQITMTPIAAIKGLTEPDTHGFGVILEPHGLVLAQPGTLKISKSRLKLSPDAFAFTGYDKGNDTRLEIAKLAGEVAIIPVDGFSIIGARTHGAGLATQRQRFAAAVPRSQGDRLRHRIAAHAGRNDHLVRGYLRDYWRLLEAAEAGKSGNDAFRVEACRALRLAAAAYMRSVTAARNAGMSLPDFVEQHMITMRQWSFLHFECRREAEAMCRSTLDPTDIQRQAIAECDAGGRSYATHGGLACEAAAKWSREAIERCMPNDLVIRTKSSGTFTDKGNCRQRLKFDLTIRIKLRASSIDGYREGSGGHVVHDYKHDYPDCPCNPGGRDLMTPISATTASRALARVKIERGSDGQPKVWIWLDPGRLKMRWSMATCGGSSDTVEDDTWWRDNFFAHFKAKLVGDRLLFDPMPRGIHGGAYTQFNADGGYSQSYGTWRGKEEAVITLGRPE